jgi:hypothetical protein
MGSFCMRVFATVDVRFSQVNRLEPRLKASSHKISFDSAYAGLGMRAIRHQVRFLVEREVNTVG